MSIIGCHFDRQKRCGQLVIVDFKFLTDNVILSLKEMQWRCQPVVVGFKFVTKETTAVRKRLLGCERSKSGCCFQRSLDIFSSCHLDVGCLVFCRLYRSVVVVCCLLAVGCVTVGDWCWFMVFGLLIVGCWCRLSLTFILLEPSSAPCYVQFTRDVLEMFASERPERCCKPSFCCQTNLFLFFP